VAEGASCFGAVYAACDTLYIRQRRPDGGIKCLEPEVGGYETVATVNSNSGTNKHAIDIDDVGLQHRECLFPN
jgi:hypothetical protein